MPTTLPTRGRILITGPSNSGKTYLTARALENWVDGQGDDSVAVLDFAPELKRDGVVLGGRLERETDLPPAAWVGVLDAHAPRSEGETLEASRELARENAQRANRLFEGMPAAPKAVFVNDATIPFQHEAGTLETLCARCESAELVVINAFESDELGTDDPISRRERRVLEQLDQWADRRIRLGGGS